MTAVAFSAYGVSTTESDGKCDLSVADAAGTWPLLDRWSCHDLSPLQSRSEKFGGRSDARRTSSWAVLNSVSSFAGAPSSDRRLVEEYSEATGALRICDFLMRSPGSQSSTSDSPARRSILIRRGPCRRRVLICCAEMRIPRLPSSRAISDPNRSPFLAASSLRCQDSIGGRRFTERHSSGTKPLRVRRCIPRCPCPPFAPDRHGAVETIVLARSQSTSFPTSIIRRVAIHLICLRNPGKVLCGEGKFFDLSLDGRRCSFADVLLGEMGVDRRRLETGVVRLLTRDSCSEFDSALSGAHVAEAVAAQASSAQASVFQV